MFWFTKSIPLIASISFSGLAVASIMRTFTPRPGNLPNWPPRRNPSYWCCITNCTSGPTIKWTSRRKFAELTLVLS